MRKIKEKEEKLKYQWLDKVNKFLDCEAVIILKGAKSWINFLNTFCPEEIKNIKKGIGFCSQYKLRNITVKFMENPVLENQTVIIDKK